MKQIDVKQFLASLGPKGRREAEQDIMELKKRIWERVTSDPVSGVASWQQYFRKRMVE